MESEERLSAPKKLDLTLTHFSLALGVRCRAAAPQTQGFRKAAGSSEGEVCPAAEDDKGVGTLGPGASKGLVHLENWA